MTASGPSAGSGAFSRFEFIVAGLVQLTGTGLVGHIYEIQATNDLILWTTIDAQMVGVTGSIAFIDFDAPNYSSRFYRTRDMLPRTRVRRIAPAWKW